MRKKDENQLTIGWLYPELMSTYGDIGNIIVLTKRCQWRGIGVEVVHFALDEWQEWKSVDLLFMGGAQDTQQGIVAKDLTNASGAKAKFIKNKINAGIPGLFICGAYQFLGNYYLAADGSKLPGLGLFNIYTKHPGEESKRLIGNIITQSTLINDQLVGFENHGGRTYLGDGVTPFATVTKGFGNNGEDLTEGVIFKNAIGTYLHGPILPKNPELADWFIQKALEVKYQKEVQLTPLDDTMEKIAHDAIISRLQ